MLFKRKKATQRREKYLFVIGFNKTGTTSVHRLFQKNGYMSAHWDEGNLAKTMLENAKNSKPILEGYDHQYDVFSDMVFRSTQMYFEGNSLFKQLDKDYPNAYFLYNTRDMEKWLASRAKHPHIVNDETNLDFHKRLLGTSELVEVFDYWRQQRLRFEEDIHHYFKHKQNFIELDITDNKFVEKLVNLTGFTLSPEHWDQYNKTV